MTDLIQTDDHGPVRLIVMNRADKLNALNGELSAGLMDALAAAGADDSVAAIVLAGEGRAFSAGADMKEAASHAGQPQRKAIQGSGRSTGLFSAILNCEKPVIAAVNGFALGAGCAIAISADLVVAGEGAIFGYPEVKRGLAATAVTPTVVQQIGRKAASELLLLCENVSAAEAHRLGLVNRVTPDGETRATALAMAATLAGFDHDALWATKRMIRRSADLPLDQAHAMATDAMLVMGGFREDA